VGRERGSSTGGGAGGLCTDRDRDGVWVGGELLTMKDATEDRDLSESRSPSRRVGCRADDSTA